MRREITGQYKEINNWLKKQGRNPLGQPLLKLVWSDNEIESRYGHFTDFYGKIYLRDVTENRIVPKYNYISGRWVLEKWLPLTNKELPNSYDQGTYEPFWVFQDKQGNYLDVTMKVIQFFIGFTGQSSRANAHERAQQMRDDDKKALDQEIEDFMNIVDNSDIGASLRASIIND
jgi:hypothetical protein